MVLKNLESGLRAKFDELPRAHRIVLDRMIALNKLLTNARSEREAQPHAAGAGA